MFKADIVLVNEQIQRYGLVKPMVDLGGLARPTIADYALTIKSGIQRERYISLPGRPFDSIDPEYKILNPENGDPCIEESRTRYPGYWGTIVCLNVIEHVVNPFEVFSAFAKLLKPGGLLVVSTVLSFPYHPSPIDFFRYSPDCLKMLCVQAGLTVLEGGRHLDIPADAGVRDIHTNRVQEIIAVYVTARRLT